MPELPEVETTRLGIAPRITGQCVCRLEVRQRRLRWPIPDGLEAAITGARINAVQRRGKYLLLRTLPGTALLHLGMSGSLRLVTEAVPPGKHDHVDFVFEQGVVLRFNDPRRFGCLLWTDADPLQHPLLSHLGPEPLDDSGSAGHTLTHDLFDSDYLYRQSKGRRIAIKQHLMNARIVVGVGNIYASEALFRAGIHPARAAGRISRRRMDQLVAAVKEVLAEAVRAGGTTLRDFSNSDGRPGYFSQALRVYGRTGLPCMNCGAPLRQIRQVRRATFYCATCQT